MKLYLNENLKIEETKLTKKYLIEKDGEFKEISRVSNLKPSKMGGFSIGFYKGITTALESQGKATKETSFGKNGQQLKTLKNTEEYQAVLDFSSKKDAKMIGTLLHEEVAQAIDENSLSNEIWADNFFIQFLAQKENEGAFEAIVSELPFGVVFENDLEYGGTVDLIAILEGKMTLIDFKTGNFYLENVYQISAYFYALKTQFALERAVILQEKKGENEVMVIELSESLLQSAFEGFKAHFQFLKKEKEMEELAKNEGLPLYNKD